MFYIKGSITTYNYLFASYLCEFAYIRHKKWGKLNTFILLFSIMRMHEYKGISLFADTHYICIFAYMYLTNFPLKINRFNLISII